jgi:ubiquinone/menaquinone biosynthesis C-methylase UbiE
VKVPDRGVAGHAALTSLWARVFAAAYDPFLSVAERRGLAALRAEVLADARGRVVELGAGTGLNVRHYPSVGELILTEPEPAMVKRLQRRAAGARVLQAPAERLPFEDASVDTVVSTLVLCTVPDLESALAEIRRVLAPGGRLLFLEHVRSDSARLARWQDRLHDPWRVFAGGCHCNRATLAALSTSGFAVDVHHREDWRWMPAIVRPIVSGIATRT